MITIEEANHGSLIWQSARRLPFRLISRVIPVNQLSRPPFRNQEKLMHYKTIALDLLRQYPELYRQLRQEKAVLPALDRYARELKASHQAWTERLSAHRPGSDLVQTESEGLELAIQELEVRLRLDSPRNPADALSLDDAMTFIRRPTSTA
jgi:hypothetical protein